MPGRLRADDVYLSQFPVLSRLGEPLITEVFRSARWSLNSRALLGFLGPNAFCAKPALQRFTPVPAVLHFFLLVFLVVGNPHLVSMCRFH